MASNKIQIKRSTSTAISSVSLSAGELAFSACGNILAIGSLSGGAPIAIGGERTPGILTANQALVANSTLGINRIIVANVSVNRISANNDYGTAGYVLTSGGSGSNVWWTSSAGFGVDTNLQFTWTNTHTFQETVTFSKTIDGTANNALKLGGVDASLYLTGTLAACTFTVNSALASYVATLTANNSGSLGGELATYFASNSTLYSTFQTTAGLSANVAKLTANNANNLNGQEASYYTTNSNFGAYVFKHTANNTSFVGTVSAANVVSNAQLISNLGAYALLAGSGGTTLFTSTVNAFTYSTGSGYGNITTGGAKINATHIAIGNSSVNGFITANSTKVYFTGTSYNANVASFIGALSSDLVASKSYVDDAVAGVTSGAASQSYVDTAAATAYSNAVTYVNSPVFGIAAYACTAFTNAIARVYANSGTFTGTQEFRANTLFTANASFNSNVTMGVGTTINAKDVVVSGNLSVLGVLAAINTTELQIKDSSVLLSDNQASTASYTDAVDFTIYGQFGNTANVWYSGVYRDASLSDGHYTKAVWKLFAARSGTGVGAVSSGTVNTLTDSEADPTNYRLGTLYAYLEPYGSAVGTGSPVRGGIVANSSAILLQANSTLPVTISANSISLSSALSPQNGGTGLTSYTTGDIIYASGASTMSKLTISGGQVGYVLQVSSSNLPVYDTLDGGSF